MRCLLISKFVFLEVEMFYPNFTSVINQNKSFSKIKTQHSIVNCFCDFFFINTEILKIV
jgi:hypothetical protein